MKKLLVGVAVLPFLAGVAMAGQPAPLSDAQMDRVTAGLDVLFTYGSNTFTATVSSPETTPLPTKGGYIDLSIPSLDGATAPGLPFRVIGGTL